MWFTIKSYKAEMFSHVDFSNEIKDLSTTLADFSRSKPEMALAEIDRAIAAGVRFGCVLADAG